MSCKSYFFAVMTACFTCSVFAEMPQVVTSEVFGDSRQEVTEYVQEDYVEPVREEIPVWPLAGSEADVEIVCDETTGTIFIGVGVEVVE